MKSISEIYGKIRELGKVVASHATAEGLRVYVNIGDKQVVRVDVKMNAKEEVEALLKKSPFFAANKNNL